MRKEAGQLSQVPSGAPGREYLSIDDEEAKHELSLVSVFISVPNVGHVTGSFVRVNLFADLDNTRQHVASAICPQGTIGEVMTVSGHTADSWHVYLQATRSLQPDIKLGMAAKPCCAEPRVRVRADLLSLAFAPAEVGLGDLQWFPLVPWGVEHGAPNTYTVTGTAALALPAGARLVHWQALGTAPGSFVEFDGLAAGPQIVVGNTVVKEGFPAAQYVTQIVYSTLSFGLFEIVI